MTDIGQHRGWAAFGGFIAAIATLGLLVLAFTNGLLAGLGSAAGGSVPVLAVIAICLIITGCVLMSGAQPESAWRSFGKGLIVGGSIGFVLMIAFVVLVWIALSRLTF